MMYRLHMEGARSLPDDGTDLAWHVARHVPCAAQDAAFCPDHRPALSLAAVAAAAAAAAAAVVAATVRTLTAALEGAVGRQHQLGHLGPCRGGPKRCGHQRITRRTDCHLCCPLARRSRHNLWLWRELELQLLWVHVIAVQEGGGGRCRTVPELLLLRIAIRRRCRLRRRSRRRWWCRHDRRC